MSEILYLSRICLIITSHLRQNSNHQPKYLKFVIVSIFTECVTNVYNFAFCCPEPQALCEVKR